MRAGKHAVFALAAVTAMLALTGCGGGSKTTSTTSSASNSSSSSASSSAPTTTTSGTPPEQFRQVLINGSNATPKQADCVVNGVLKKIGRAKFDRLYGKGNTPEDVKNVIFQTTEKCAPRGFGR
jgi:ABC-type glycerol-3-phosphate transport system substrate-binding protein